MPAQVRKSLAVKRLAADLAQVGVDVGRLDVVPEPVRVLVLEQLLAGQLVAGAHDAREPPVAGRDLVDLAALAAELEGDRAAVDLDVAVAHRGQAEALVVAGVLRVADADQRGLEQAHDGRQHLLARQAAAPEVGLDARADRRQRAAEHQHAVELVRVAHRAPAAVVAVLLAAAGVAPGRLEMALALRADPDVGPGRRDRQHAQPPQLVRVLDRAALRVAVAEAAARAPPRDPGRAVGDVAQPGGRGRRGGGRRIGLRGHAVAGDRLALVLLPAGHRLARPA